MQITFQPQFENAAVLANIAAADDGRVWRYSVINSFGVHSYIQPLSLTYKSPGPIDQNWVGAWDLYNLNDISDQWFLTNLISYPQVGYFANSAREIIYDNKRQALYIVPNAQTPYYSQNVKLQFQISRNNGQTWSDPITINDIDFANRGYVSMALDESTGDLLFGFYDGRNDPTYQTVQYFGAIFPAKQLDCLVQKIPLSAPFVVPAFNPNINSSKEKKNADVLKSIRNRRFDRR